MPNKDTGPLREKLFEEYEDSLFRLAMHDLAVEEGKSFLGENEKLKNNPDFQPSEAACQKFSQQLSVHLRKKNTRSSKLPMSKLVGRFAVVSSIVVVLLFTTVASVEAVRLKVLNFLMDVRQEYTSFYLKENENNSGTKGAVVNWGKSYVPTYIPEGYEVSSTTYNDQVKKIIFKDQQGSLIIYTQLNEATNPGVDTENASLSKNININGHEGTLVIKNSIITIVWVIDDSLFTLQAKTSEETALKIAEGVKYLD